MDLIPGFIAQPRPTATAVAITDVMSRRLVTAPPDAPVAKLITLLRDKHVGCIPIVDDGGRPLGVVTKLDLVETMNDVRATARELMMPIAMTLDVNASLARAAKLMSAEHIHHVLIVDDDRKLIGVVSSLDLAHWLARTEP